MMKYQHFLSALPTLILCASFFPPEALADSKSAKKIQPAQISYNHKTEVVFGDNPGIALPDEVEKYIQEKYKDLHISPYFNTSFLANPSKVRKHHVDSKNKDRGRLISFTTDDGFKINCTHFDRGSDELVIIGSGFTTARETMSSLVEMFKTDSSGKKTGRDVLIFDFRGHGKNNTHLLSCINFNVAKMIIDTDSRSTRLGEIEERDVLAVVNGIKKYKTYKKILGVSLCFGSFVFLKAQTVYPGLFDKIVVDGCWDRLKLIIDKIKADPFALWNSKKGGFSQAVFKQRWAQESLLFFVKNILGLKIGHDISLVKELPKINNTPILFIHGKDDVLVSRNEFESLWHAAQVDYKVALITSNRHSTNHYKQKELYKFVCEVFFESQSVDECREKLLCKDALEKIV